MSMNDVENTLDTNNGKLRQFLVAISVNMLSLTSGLTWGWSSPVIPQLRQLHPPVGETPMTEEQLSWVSGLMAIGGLIITPFLGMLTERVGRKNFAHLTGLPHIISWLLIIFGQNYTCICLARLFGGMGAGMTLFIVPLYIGEIASTDIRGRLGGLLLFIINLGELIAFIFGAYLSYHLFASLSIIVSLSFVAIFGFMPETPVYLLRRNRPLEAHKSLMFLRGNNRAVVERELVMLQSQAKIIDTSSSKIKLMDLLRDRATRKGLILSFGLLAAQELSGIFAMISYSETIFQRAGSTLSADTASIIIAFIQIVVAYSSSMLVERTGRRLLLLISCVGMTISHCFVGLFFCLQENHYDVSSIGWLPVVALSTYIVSYCLGIGPVPFVVISEVFKLDVSSFATTMTFIFYWTVSFTSIQVFTLSMQYLGVCGCFFVLAGFCTTSFIFVYLLLPETKGRERQDIIDELGGKLFSHKQKTLRTTYHFEAKPV